MTEADDAFTDFFEGMGNWIVNAGEDAIDWTGGAFNDAGKWIAGAG